MTKPTNPMYPTAALLQLCVLSLHAGFQHKPWDFPHHKTWVSLRGATRESELFLSGRESKSTHTLPI